MSTVQSNSAGGKAAPAGDASDSGRVADSNTNAGVTPAPRLPSQEIGKCCKRPSIATMDYVKHSPANWNCGEPRINRVCLNCYAHWFGAPGAVKQYTRKEWDAEVSRPERCTFPVCACEDITAPCPVEAAA